MLKVQIFRGLTLVYIAADLLINGDNPIIIGKTNEINYNIMTSLDFINHFWRDILSTECLFAWLSSSDFEKIILLIFT
jgi:hypothetical protein